MLKDNHLTNSKEFISFWNRIAQVLKPSHSKKRHTSISSQQSDSSYSNSFVSNESLEQAIDENVNRRKSTKKLIQTPSSQTMLLPPFSPTYCKANEFPYSNFYVKLPDGKWMIQYRDGNREVLRTDILESYMV